MAAHLGKQLMLYAHPDRQYTIDPGGTFHMIRFLLCSLSCLTSEPDALVAGKGP